MRRPIIVGNWKMYTNAADAHVLSTTIRNNVANLEGVEVVLCPPVIWLSELAGIVGRGGKVKLGVQNIFHEPEGAYTGEISPMMVRGLAEYAIVGHSERRRIFGETSIDINEKVLAALKSGLSPIICVGELKKSSRFPELAVKELTEALMHVPKKYLSKVVVSYEPVWAIGTGDVADPEYVSKVITALREIVHSESPVLYGGSVDSKNAVGFAKRPEIDGLLVGGASLRANEFVKICRIWSENKSFK